MIITPLFHAGGSAALGLCALGATHVLLDGFSPEKVMSAIERHRVTHMFLPPTAIRLLLKHPDVRRRDYTSLRCFLYGSAPTPVELIAEAVDVFGPVMATSFGQTEAGGEPTFMPPSEIAAALAQGHPDRLRSCGRSTSFVRVEVMDDNGQLLAPREVGELVVRSTQIMSGYYNNPEETARVREHGWHHTGDIGYRDADGFFYLVDRKRDLIISAGFNIFPSEIESVILQHPAVADCAVIGVPHEDWGEVPIAIVEPRKSEFVDANELDALCASKLSLRQMPQRFEVWAELPRGPAGKVSRRLIREQLLARAA
jgi:acyl-CoA synthetase (AMP-forming)/AMP-acid ligase II